MNIQKEVQNILLVSLNDNFTKKVVSLLSNKLDMYNIDCYDMVVYDLIKPKEVIEKCGYEYFKKKEKGVIKNCSTFLNTCISINFDLINQYNEYFKNSLIFYLDLPLEKINKVPDKIDFENRINILKNLADFTIKLEKKSVNNAVENILNIMRGLYENCWKNIKLC